MNWCNAGGPSAAALAGAAAASMGVTLGSTMASTMTRDAKTKFLKWFNALTPRQAQASEEQELPRLERVRYHAESRTVHGVQ